MADVPDAEELRKRKQEDKAFWNNEIKGNYAELMMLNSGVFEEMYVHVTDLLLNEFPRDAALQVLDLASNGGEPAAHVAKAFPNACVVSTDIAEVCVEVGQRYAASRGVSNIEFRTADAEDLAGFSDGSFDAVTCTMGIFFMAGYERALAEMRRVTRPGGKVVLATWGRQEDGNLWKIVANLMRGMEPPEHSLPPIFKKATRFADPTAELIPAMRAAGWSETQHEFHATTARCGSPELLYDIMINTGLQIKDLVARLVERGANEQQVHAQGKEILEGVLQERGFLLDGRRVEVDGNMMVFVVGTA